MRRLLVLAAGVGALSIAGVATAASGPVLQTTGRITSLDMAHVGIGRVQCAIGAKTSRLAATFAVGENVTVRCAGKTLETIELAPVRSGHAGQSITLIGAARKPIVSTLPSSPVTSSVNVHGAITALTPNSITIGDSTCSFNTTDLQIAIGEVIGMTCTTYASGMSDSSVSIPLP
jgi:hypothetical protein